MVIKRNGGAVVKVCPGVVHEIKVSAEPGHAAAREQLPRAATWGPECMGCSEDGPQQRGGSSSGSSGGCDGGSTQP
jgi:hypothetical protein